MWEKILCAAQQQCWWSTCLSLKPINGTAAELVGDYNSFFTRPLLFFFIIHSFRARGYKKRVRSAHGECIFHFIVDRTPTMNARVAAKKSAARANLLLRERFRSISLFVWVARISIACAARIQQSTIKKRPPRFADWFPNDKVLLMHADNECREKRRTRGCKTADSNFSIYCMFNHRAAPWVLWILLCAWLKALHELLTA